MRTTFIRFQYYDCYYHGYSGGPGGVCAECEAEARQKLERGSIQPDRDTRQARVEMGKMILDNPSLGEQKEKKEDKDI
jgi:hypothetical protein